MYPSVKEVHPHEDYTLSIVFENGEKGILDMKPILKFGVFQRLKKYEIFRQVRVGFDTVLTSIQSSFTPNVWHRRPPNKPLQRSACPPAAELSVMRQNE